VCQSFARSTAEFHRHKPQSSAQLPEAAAVHGTTQVTENNQNSCKSIFLLSTVWYYAAH